MSAALTGRGGIWRRVRDRWETNTVVRVLAWMSRKGAIHGADSS